MPLPVGTGCTAHPKGAVFTASAANLLAGARVTKSPGKPTKAPAPGPGKLDLVANRATGARVNETRKRARILGSQRADLTSLALASCAFLISNGALLTMFITSAEKR
jgi:hypothetical protein